LDGKVGEPRPILSRPPNLIAFPAKVCTDKGPIAPRSKACGEGCPACRSALLALGCRQFESERHYGVTRTRDAARLRVNGQFWVGTALLSVVREVKRNAREGGAGGKRISMQSGATRRSKLNTDARRLHSALHERFYKENPHLDGAHQISRKISGLCSIVRKACET
jgi:hypothetical protein